MRPFLRLVLTAALLLLCGAAPPPRTPCSPPRRSRAWTCPGGATRHEAKLEELHSRHVDLVFLGDSITQDYEVSGPPEWRDFAPIWQRFYGDAQRGQPGLQRRCDVASAVAHRERRGRRHRAEGRGDPDRRQQSRPAALVGRGHGRRHRRHRDATAPPPAAHQAAAAGRSAVGPLGLGDRDDSWRSTGRWRRAMATAATSRSSISGTCSCRNGRLDTRPVLRPEADAARRAAASHRAGAGADGRGDRADARRAARRQGACGARGNRRAPMSLRGAKPTKQSRQPVCARTERGLLRRCTPRNDTVRRLTPAPPPAAPSHAWRTPACWPRGRRCRSPA